MAPHHFIGKNKQISVKIYYERRPRQDILKLSVRGYNITNLTKNYKTKSSNDKPLVTIYDVILYTISL